MTCIDYSQGQIMTFKGEGFILRTHTAFSGVLLGVGEGEIEDLA